MYETFKPRDFKPGSIDIIETANSIIAEYQAAGFTLTLRQLYYQFVARDLLPNRQTEYKRLGSIINDARLAGMIDWSAIEDRTRFLREHQTEQSPQNAVESLANRYIEDVWLAQSAYVEVWIEKDALIGVIEPVCGRWRVPYFACRGYTSQSEQYRAGKRLEAKYEEGFEPVILHLGDHDPSGLDMTRDNNDRLGIFSTGAPISMRRLALNMDQIRRYRPPHNPAKETDSRISGYVTQYGTRSSWELDALDPKVIDALIDDEIRSIVHPDDWQRSIEQEARNRSQLRSAAQDMR